MADDQSYGGFTNPNFVTPEQIQQNRQIITALLSGAYAPDTSKHWTGALAQGLMGLRGGNLVNQTNQMQRQALQQGGDANRTAAAGNPFAAIMMGGQNPTSPQASNSGGSGDGNALKAAILMQESGNNPNIRSSYAGAVGPGQIMPQTFASIAKPGESINDATDNRNVSGRLLDKYTQDYGGDPARAAVAYYSGPGNVASPGSPTPWIKDISRDKAGNPIKPVSSYVSDVTRRMGGGQQVAQNGGGNLADYYVNPSVPQALRDTIRQGNTPVGVEDVRGRQGYTTTMGGPHLTPQGPGFDQGYRGPFNVTTPGASVAGTATYSANQPNGISGAANAGMDVAEKMAGRGAAIGATVKQTAEDIANANASIPQISILKTMRDTIKNSPTMQFGPTAPWLTNLQMMVAQHAPDLISPQQMAGLAAANSVDKLTAQLGNILSSNGSPTDAKLFNNLHAIPGRAVNSKEGMLDLIDMIIQQQGINHQFVSQNMGKIAQGMGPAEFNTMRNKYFEDHPVINPATRNPITLDLRKSSEGAPPETKRIGDKTYIKVNGKWHEGS